MSLRKADILQGASRVEEVFIEALGGNLPLRPLTDGQWARVKAKRSARIRAKGQSGDSNPNIDFSIGELEEDAYFSNVLAVKYGIATEDRWAESEIEQMPLSAVNEIAMHIYELTGVKEDIEDISPDTQEELESFRTDE